MDYFDSSYSTSVVDSLNNLYDQVILYLPNVLIALIVLILGWLIGSALGKLVNKILTVIGVDAAANKIGMQQLSARTGRTFSIAKIGQWIIKWFFFLASFIAAADILGLHQVTQFFYSDVLPYAGHVIVAMAIMLLGILAANFLADVVEGVVKAAGFSASRALASLTRWAILIFTLIAVLSELQIATSFLQDLFRAIVAMLAIAAGLAFGLGGRDHAKRVLDDIEAGLGRRA